MSKKFVNFEEENSLSKYFKDVRKSTLLTPNEEVELAKRIQAGDESAIEHLVNANLKFVISVAKDYQNQGLSLGDLISEGNYGLVKAASRFDYTRGFRFISYAVWWIKQAIISSLNENARIVRLPSNVINKLSNLKKEIEKFEFENEREPIYGEILDENGDAVDLTLYPRCASLNDVINEDGDEMLDMIVSEKPEEELVDKRLKDELMKTLDYLSDRDKYIIKSYYGIDTDCEPMTLEAIGEQISLSRERVRQCKYRALRVLKNYSENLYNVLNS